MSLIGKRVNDGILSIQNRQRRVKLNPRSIRQVLVWVLAEEFGIHAFELSLQFVGTGEITALNEAYLKHGGSTDVITFDYDSAPNSGRLIGDVVVCVDEALSQARRFKVTWQTELMRYAVHGLLHLMGFDDKTAAKRGRMKHREDELMRKIADQFTLSKVGARKRA